MNALRGTCAATGKVSYADRKSAKAVLSVTHYRDVSVFKCGECDWFHLGGWHGTKDRAAHRVAHGDVLPETDMPIEQAARYLRISEFLVRRLIATGKIRGTHTHANPTDIQRIFTQILRTP